MRAKFAVVILALGVSSTAAAADLNRIGLLTQGQFRALSEDLGSALSYKPISPAEPLGITGFDVGLEVTATEIKNRGAWDLASSGDAPDTLYVPKLHVIKGLPFGIDVGALYSKVPGQDISLWGAEARYAILQGSTLSPALSVRGTYTKLTGVDQIDLNTKGLELTLSKGFAMLTPYAGIGRVWVDSSPNTITPLHSESFEHNKFYVGANFNLMVVNLAIEYDRTGDANTYGAKVGLRF